MRYYIFPIFYFIICCSYSLQAQNALPPILETDTLIVEELYQEADKVIGYVSYEDTSNPVSIFTQNLFNIIFILILIYLSFIFFVPGFLEFVFLFRKIVYRKRWAIRMHYKECIFDYLVNNEDKNIHLSDGKINKRVLTEILYDLVRYIEGEDRDRLLNIYNQFGIEKYLNKRIKRSLFNKGYFLKILATLSSSSDSEKLLKKMINDPNSEVRMYAMQALFVIDESCIYPIFENYTYTLSLWEQMNHYYYFKTKHITPPDFHGLLYSKNDSIVMFAARMIRHFNQKGNFGDSYKFLSEHPNIYVQAELFRTLAELDDENLEGFTQDFMVKVNPAAKRHVITYLSKLKTATTEQLMQFYYEDQSVEFRLHILYCIYNFVDGGADDIIRFSNQTEDRKLQELSLHLINHIL